MDGLLEALQSGAAFKRKRGPRPAGKNNNNPKNCENHDDRLGYRQKSTLTSDAVFCVLDH